MKTTRVGCGLAMLALALGCGCRTPAGVESQNSKVVWRGTTSYDKLVITLPITPAEAYERAKQEADHIGYIILFPEAEILVGKWYWFGKAGKIDIPLTGFYVHGETGAVEFRRSTKSIKPEKARLPEKPWQND